MYTTMFSQEALCTTMCSRATIQEIDAKGEEGGVTNHKHAGNEVVCIGGTVLAPQVGVLCQQLPHRLQRLSEIWYARLSHRDLHTSRHIQRLLLNIVTMGCPGAISRGVPLQ